MRLLFLWVTPLILTSVLAFKWKSDPCVVGGWGGAVHPKRNSGLNTQAINTWPLWLLPPKAWFWNEWGSSSCWGVGEGGQGR